MSTPRLVLGAVMCALILTGCSGEGPSLPGTTNVEVDTPKLVAMKAEAGIEDCEPGAGEQGGELPDLTLPCLGGGPDVNLADLKGPLIVNVWYSNCGPCREEMPALQKFYADHGDQVGLLGIDIEIYPDLAISFAQIVGATYPQLADPGGELLDQPDVRIAGFPQSFILDEDGRIVHQFGPIESEAELVELAEQHLGVDL